MPQVAWEFTPEQHDVIADYDSPEIVAVGGYGSGKTYVLARWALLRSLANPPGTVGIIVVNLWRNAKRAVLPHLRAALEEMGLPYRVNMQDGSLKYGRGKEQREIWFASGEIPENLAGPNLAWAAMDEYALQDEECHRRLASRLRDPRATTKRQLLMVGTPEGMGWGYKKSLEAKRVVMPTWSNTYLPAEYMDTLKRTFPDELRYRMYVGGEAVMLEGMIYTNFQDRHLRKCLNPDDTRGETCIGLDFNVGYMCTPIARCIGDEVHIWGEVMSTNTDTEAHLKRVREYLQAKGVGRMGRQGGGVAFGDYMLGPNGQAIDAFMDASGAARKTSATRSDRDIVKAMGFWPKHDPSNPPVRDRIGRVQYALAHDKLFVDPEGAPTVARALREHGYKKGSQPPEPNKRWGEREVPLDAVTDAVGYLVVGRVRGMVVTGRAG